MKKPTHFLIYDTGAGRIMSQGKTTRPDWISHGDTQAVLEGYVLTREEARGLYVDADKIEPVQKRPRLDTPAATLALGADLRIPAVPAGTKVYVDGALLGETTVEETLEISFETDGVYRIHLESPFPWMPLKHELEVTPCG